MADKPFLTRLHSARRSDLRLIDGDPDFIEFLVAEQQRYQTIGYGESYPDAVELIIEKLAEPIGRVLVNFSSNNVHVVDIGLLPEARGRGYGTSVMRGLQLAAAKVAAPLTLRVRADTPRVRALYQSLGFVAEERQSGFDLMAWYPPREQRRFFI